MNDLLEKVLLLKDLSDNNKIDRLEKHEVHPNLQNNEKLNYVYFTLPVCLNFQRSSPALWKAALETFEDKNTNYLFYPEKVIKTKRDIIQKGLIKHKLALQVNKHIDIWITISKTFAEKFEANPRNLLEEGEMDVVQILDLIQHKYKALFPYLRGPKLSNYWLFILSRFTDAKFSKMDEISIIPDTHVIKCSIHLGLVTSSASPEEVVIAWKRLLKNTGITPVEMHPVLWNWSRANFKPDVLNNL